MKDLQKTPMPATSKPDEISQIELYRFLRKLSTLYNDPIAGNIALSRALLDLVKRLEGLSEKSNPAIRRPNLVSSFNLENLKQMDANGILEFISDETKTKNELVELATARFSIPPSKLMRMRSQEIRERIRAALLHEDSITIIADEARRSGSNRSS